MIIAKWKIWQASQNFGCTVRHIKHSYLGTLRLRILISSMILALSGYPTEHVKRLHTLDKWMYECWRKHNNGNNNSKGFQPMNWIFHISLSPQSHHIFGGQVLIIVLILNLSVIFKCFSSNEILSKLIVAFELENIGLIDKHASFNPNWHKT